MAGSRNTYVLIAVEMVKLRELVTTDTTNVVGRLIECSDKLSKIDHPQVKLLKEYSELLGAQIKLLEGLHHELIDLGKKAKLEEFIAWLNTAKLSVNNVIKLESAAGFPLNVQSNTPLARSLSVHSSLMSPPPPLVPPSGYVPSSERPSLVSKGSQARMSDQQTLPFGLYTEAVRKLFAGNSSDAMSLFLADLSKIDFAQITPVTLLDSQSGHAKILQQAIEKATPIVSNAILKNLFITAEILHQLCVNKVVADKLALRQAEWHAYTLLTMDDVIKGYPGLVLDSLIKLNPTFVGAIDLAKSIVTAVIKKYEVDAKSPVKLSSFFWEKLKVTNSMQDIYELVEKQSKSPNDLKNQIIDQLETSGLIVVIRSSAKHSRR